MDYTSCQPIQSIQELMIADVTPLSYNGANEHIISRKAKNGRERPRRSIYRPVM